MTSALSASEALLTRLAEEQARPFIDEAVAKERMDMRIERHAHHVARAIRLAKAICPPDIRLKDGTSQGITPWKDSPFARGQQLAVWLYDGEQPYVDVKVRLGADGCPRPRLRETALRFGAPVLYLEGRYSRIAPGVAGPLSSEAPPHPLEVPPAFDTPRSNGRAEPPALSLFPVSQALDQLEHLFNHADR